MEATEPQQLSESPEPALARRPGEHKAQEQPGPQGQEVVPPSPAGPTCQLPQPHVHVLLPAFAAALSMDDHLVGSDADLFGASCPLKPGPQTPGLCGPGAGPAVQPHLPV